MITRMRKLLVVRLTQGLLEKRKKKKIPHCSLRNKRTQYVPVMVIRCLTDPQDTKKNKRQWKNIA